MCFHKNKKGRPINGQVKANSLRGVSQSKVDASKKKTASAPANLPAQPVPPSIELQQPPSAPDEKDAKEKTCPTDKSDLMAISLYKTKKKDGSGSGGPPKPDKPPDKEADSPEVFENNAQVESLNPINVTQIFVDSVIPQTNMSKNHTDIVDQNTLECADANMDDVIFDPLDDGEEQFPEVPQPRPAANVLQPEDETVNDNTMSDRQSRAQQQLSEKRAVTARRTEHHRTTLTPSVFTPPPCTPQLFTPPPQTKSEKGTVKRAARGGVSTRTVPRRPSDHRQTAPPSSPEPVESTLPSHEPVNTTQRTQRPSQHQQQLQQATSTTVHTVVQTAQPMQPSGEPTVDPTRDAVDSTATGRVTRRQRPGNFNSAGTTRHDVL